MWSWSELDTWGTLDEWGFTPGPGFGWTWSQLTAWDGWLTWGSLGSLPSIPVGPFTIRPFDAVAPIMAGVAYGSASIAVAGVGAPSITPAGSTPPTVVAIPATRPTVTPAVVAPVRITIRAFSASTMTAWVTTPPDLTLPGYAVFIGGDVAPEVAGLIDAGEPYLWFQADGTLIVEDGT